MSCHSANSLLHDYFDGELDSVRALEFEGHLRSCAGCANELLDLDLLSGRLAFTQLYAPAPASLRRKVRSDLSPIPRATTVSKALLWHWLAAAAPLLLLAIVGWRVSRDLRNDDYQSELPEKMLKLT